MSVTHVPLRPIKRPVSTPRGGSSRSPGAKLERQREGIAKAKAEGRYKGRPPSIDVGEIKRLSAEMGPAAIAKQLGIARSSVYRLLGGG